MQPKESPALRALIDDRYAELAARCRLAGVALHDDAGVAERIRRALLASDFAYDIWFRQPQLLAPQGLERLRAGGDASTRIEALRLDPDEAACMATLRRFRHAEALRLVFRDVNGLDELPETLSATSVLYEVLLGAALGWSERALAARYGHSRDHDGVLQRMVVVGFGKLGGSELNFSSDIDLVLAYPHSGQSDGPRPLDNSEYFVRMGRQLVRLLAEPTVDGICARVDLRLRPFGNAGRLALPFSAMEQYYQSEGRDWERYAWIKARPVAGDRNAGKQLQELLRPFVFRKYLDYTAFAGLREMKALIDAEVARKDLADNLKLGPGGIREVEFIVQLTQLIRGGREPSLRVRGLLPALTACEARGHIAASRAKALREAYVFLRRVENRVQMLRDAQTHDIPEDALSRERIALGLGHASWEALAAELARHRAVVSEEFAEVLVPQGGRTASVPVEDVALWRRVCAEEIDPGTLEAAGFQPGAEAAEALLKLPQAAAVRAMPPRSREQLDRLMPQLLALARDSAAPVPGLLRLCRLVQAVARRSSYLALLEEQPAARRRLADLFARSAFLAERVIAQPLLLDDVLDPRIDQLPLKRADISAEISRVLGTLDEREAEAELERINEFKASTAFRLGLAFNDGRADAVATARRLGALAESVVIAVMALAERELTEQHGRLPGEGSGFAVLGYGSLGGEELGFASDLDLVFVYDTRRAHAMSDGARPIEGSRWYQRLAQRVMNWLTVLTRAGRLYEVDTRLRPDGSKGLLVSSLEAFAEYQRSRAWTWEHQALLRARPVAGDAALNAELLEVRREILAVPRERARVLADVSDMRRRWRAERDRSDERLFDLKQGHGGLLDIEFALQGLVLAHAAERPLLLLSTANAALIEACRTTGLLDDAQAEVFARAHGELLRRALACTLDLRSRIAPREPALDSLSEEVRRVTAELGFAFAAKATTV
ncbi:bifunctional [glutamate--ammonia ligase]-adenylyl-L-tyrosine phosphorylase/[glutamate--ammonia-ligase] adenylyltransferase [Dyella sp. LX-66]|uniref:bifunctional [glutamate--ammonia ligase]-adenylyl-L-tyrosine phosphorylase/[glutamate--ammonia-ligase] adenylyltransferase n=1 Tax=unclassified Dyella TaxID=2634549 RepID=UPI001BE126CC|nr:MULTISPECIES: bifunctional [glutamate--ammonia ligase]-adenylyl-L-tyrosine phosphorylase/[glutamate--ammonia-ligase] adenylyltransferase [unclassified Dyella]MBT2116320.1 bifunctional [glutamate--ammonia ligase]-adenylyl-L-tyrosine phosphorylase/[glutamate--ammonia-ligase] adenylyltransferase [Dyella sp. LX-1]MBT2140737.1 bifunctional [glutamate--ammonia ligase]-adenylyl-L-tyrosine phosphorylase/[glutamate--ammonia-ligase] adenylyltransferase [Dyella sp. LX-66]